jgi:adenylate cyclase
LRIRVVGSFALMWRLIINGPGYFDTPYDLRDGVTTLGRAEENDIVLSGDLVSRKHARFHVKGEGLRVQDLGSRNGCFVNGKPLTGTVDLQAGDVVNVGENTLGIRQPAEAETAATERIDVGVAGVRRFAQGVDLDAALIKAKEVRDSDVLRMLDNVVPFETPVTPFNATDTRPPLAYDALLLLYKMAERLASAPSLVHFLDDCVDRLLERLDATTAVVMVRLRGNGLMVPAAVRHRGKLSEGEVPVSDAIIEAALKQGAALAVADVRGDDRFNARTSVIAYGVGQVLCVPIGPREPFVGALYVNKGWPDKEGNRDVQSVEPLLDLCVAMGHLIATAIEKFQLKERSPSEERLRSTLERFHAPHIAERWLQENKGPKGRLTRLEELPATVLFADLSGFTALSLKLPPDRVVDLLNEFYLRTSGVIFSFEGTVDKYVGDAVMAVFGAPFSRPDDPMRAVRAALALRIEWKKAMSRRPPGERPDLKIGLNTGKVLAGTVGSDARLDYTVLGETVNLASWLCASAQPGQVLVTGKTVANLGGRFDVTSLGDRSVGAPGGGPAQVLTVFEVSNEDDERTTVPGVRGD